MKAELVRGDGGVFDVDADGVRIFSKHATGRYPDSDEIIEALKGMG